MSRSYLVPGFRVTDHTAAVPLDHADPAGPTIEVFAREVVATDRQHDDLPWLVFLQGGPGAKSPRPASGAGDSWLAAAARHHRVLLLDQRGTGRSTPISARTVAGVSGLGQSDADLAAYLRLFRADSIVADCEALRQQVAGGERWYTLGQSYGGFCTMTYLSEAPEGLLGCYVTGGLPGLTATADDVYARTFPRMAAKNAAFYRRYPDDAAAVRRVADHLDAEDVRLPDGDRLTARRLRVLGNAFGMSDGYERLHWLLDDVWHGDLLSDGFLHQVMALTGFVDTPLFALQEYTYGGPGSGPTGWAAQRALERRPAFAADADPLLLTGETMFPWMFDDLAALRPFRGAAELLASYDDWPPLYDLDRLADNEVPVSAVVYHDDMYVDAGLSLDTATRVGNVRAWVTNEYEHDGLRADPDRLLSRLRDRLHGPA
ncbi:alpha/beta fold hydrolase [Nocardioides sp. YIM 152315]|uniref:alpha/beta fold hydrolase n=1 Tax=Nocardioides sp. YIM 152315 TaxID=3031760 RepID=UPI0023DA2664|nr:alpha/beta fold hydrolase [Nocardioides sp. YIM 152315]MDF1604335.1 alpha/beta fold hydrolase [Nocardioides sp. YIM 152315]